MTRVSLLLLTACATNPPPAPTTVGDMGEPPSVLEQDPTTPHAIAAEVAARSGDLEWLAAHVDVEASQFQAYCLGPPLVLGDPTSGGGPSHCGNVETLDSPEAVAERRREVASIANEILEPTCAPTGESRPVLYDPRGIGNVDFDTGASDASPDQRARYQAFLGAIERTWIVELDCGGDRRGVWVTVWRDGRPLGFHATGTLDL